MLISSLVKLASYRDLFSAWLTREIKVRYKQSVMGGLWAIIQPFSLMVIFSLVFPRFARVPTDGIPYPVFYYTALVPWVFFTNSIGFAVPSLVSNMTLVTKIYFPREILPIAGVGAAFFDFLVASSIFVFMLVFYNTSVSLAAAWLPLLVLLQILFTLGVVLFFSALLVFYRDVRFIIPLLTQLWMFASPIIYPLSAVPDEFLNIYMLNPMAVLIHSYRQVILYNTPPEPQYLLICALISLLSFLIGYAYFKKSEGQFADLL